MTIRDDNVVSGLILVSARTNNLSTRARLTKTAARIVAADAASSAMDAGQLGLDAAGFIPGVGEIADGINALVSLVRGDYLGAALSVISMIPLAGDVVGKGGKLAIWLSKMAKRQGRLGKSAQFLIKNGPKIKSTLSKFSKFVVQNRKQILLALRTITSLVRSTGNDQASSEGTPPAIGAVSKMISKSPKLKAIAEKAAPHLDQMNSAVLNVLQLAQASDDMFQKLEERAQQEMSSGGRG